MELIETTLSLDECLKAKWFILRLTIFIRIVYDACLRLPTYAK